MRIGLRLFTTFLCSFFCSALFANEYVFTGNGSFANRGNWYEGKIPPTNLPEGGVIRVKGNAIVSEGCDYRYGQYECEETFFDSQGTIIIEKDATLDFRNSTQFGQMGKILVYGTLINTTHLEAYDIGEIVVWGTFINKLWIGNQGIITIENGGEN